jgi:hypothetical protein
MGDVNGICCDGDVFFACQAGSHKKCSAARADENRVAVLDKICGKPADAFLDIRSSCIRRTTGAPEQQGGSQGSR